MTFEAHLEEDPRQMIMAALASLSANEVIRYIDDISDLDMLSLELRNRAAYEAIKAADARRVLVSIGLMKVSGRKTGEFEIELDETFTNFMADPRPDHRDLKRKMERVRQALTDHSRHKFNASGSCTSLIAGHTPVARLFHALDVLVSGSRDNPYVPLWSEIAQNYIDMSAKTELAFKSICYILEANLKPNRDFLRQFIRSNGL